MANASNLIAGRLRDCHKDRQVRDGFSCLSIVDKLRRWVAFSQAATIGAVPLGLGE